MSMLPLLPHEPAQRVAFQKACPPRAERLADDNLSDVVLTGDTQQRFADIGDPGSKSLPRPSWRASAR